MVQIMIDRCNKHSPAQPAHTRKHAYRIDEACYALGIGRTSLYELVKEGNLKLIKVAGRTLVPLSEIERLTSLDRALGSERAP